MTVTVDTNLLVRVAVRDDASQARLADQVLSNADVIAITLPCLCEFVWVLRGVYAFEATEIVDAIQSLIRSRNVAANRLAIEAGLEMLRANGDFANGVIAYEGRWLGGDTFVSFDRKAVTLMKAQGFAARRP